MANSPRSEYTFLAELSHDLKNPLNGIIGYSQLLSQTKLDKVQKMYTTSISSCCLQLLSLINDIIDFSKLSSGKMNITPSCFSMKEVMEEVNSTLGQKISDKKQKIRYIFEKNIDDNKFKCCQMDDVKDEYIVADKNKLVQIMINLISNANKFTEKSGRIIVHVNIVSSPNGKGTLLVSVEDNGKGISPEEQEKLFTPFYQSTENSNGSGLGLVITKKLVTLLGGNISIESKCADKDHKDRKDHKEKGHDHGTVVNFSITFDSYNDYKVNIEKNCLSLQGKYIIVCHTDVDTRMEISDLLFEHKAVPISCSTQKEIHRLLTTKRYPFSLVIVVDVTMGNTVRELDTEIGIIIICEGILSPNQYICISKPINHIKFLDVVCKQIQSLDVEKFKLNENKEIKDNIVKGCQILVVEDEKYNVTLLLEMLRTLGYTNVDSACDGEKALEKINKNSYDVILLDLKMPNMSGIDVLKNMKKIEKKPSVIVITASVLDSDRTQCQELGAEYFLLKPINLRHLKMILKKLNF